MTDEQLNARLSEHFSYKELTRTDRLDLQAANREEGLTVLPALTALARGLLEPVRVGMGTALVVHSAYRGPVLNAAIGGAAKSQHMKGEACDFSGPGEEDGPALEALFQKVAGLLAEQRLPFGQLIKEEQEGRYGVARWLHVSLGPPWRPAALSGQVMMMYGKRGEPARYALLRQVKVAEPPAPQAGGSNSG